MDQKYTKGHTVYDIDHAETIAMQVSLRRRKENKVTKVEHQD